MNEQDQKQLKTILYSITAQSQKLDTLKLHKKGRMQQVFPSVDEVSG
jgi:restriction endonuclease S subunit